jgi:putative transcriptional regulator
MMRENGKRKKLFERLKGSLEEGFQFAKRELNLRTTVVPDRPPNVRPQDVIRLRESLGMSQSVFARMLNVSPKTLQSWEQGTRRPSRAVLRLLQVLKTDPATVFRIVGMRPAS